MDVCILSTEIIPVDYFVSCLGVNVVLLPITSCFDESLEISGHLLNV